MKSPTYFLIKIAQEFEDRILDKDGNVILWLPEANSGRRLYGTVVAAPYAKHGYDKPDFAEVLRERYGEGYDGGHYVATTKRSFRGISGAYVWHEACIRDDVREGDTVYFDHHTSGHSHHIGDNILAIRPSNILAYKRGDEIIPYAGRVFIRPDEMKNDKIIIPKHLRKHKEQGVVVGLGVPLSGDEYRVSVGDRVLYDHAYNATFDPMPGCIIIPNTKIHAILCQPT